MEIGMKEILKTVYKKVKEFYIILMVINMKEILKMVKKKEKGYFIGIMVIIII